MNYNTLYNLYADYYHSVLLQNKEALIYLHSRGLTLATIKKFKLGYCDDSFHTKYVDTAKEIPHIYSSSFDMEKFAGYILIPLIDEHNVVYFSSRYLGDSSKNHLHLNGTLPCPFNINTLRKAETLYITESPIDAMVLEQEGFNAIAIFTSSTIKPTFINKIINFCGRIVLLFDNDKNMAGQKGSYRCADELLAKANLNSYIATPPFILGNKKTDVNILFLYNKPEFKDTINLLTKESISYKDSEYYFQEEKKRAVRKQKVELSKQTSNLIKQIKAIPITEIISRYIKVDKTVFGGQTLCPFHDDVKTKSLLFYNNSNMFFCMSGACNARGDAIEFVMRYFKIGFRDAVNKILEG